MFELTLQWKVFAAGLPHLKSICIIGTALWVNVLMNIEQLPCTPLKNKEETLNRLVLFCTGSILCHWHPHWTVAAKMSKGLIEWLPLDGDSPRFALNNNPHLTPSLGRTFPLSRGELGAETDHLFEADHLGVNVANISRSIRHHLGSNHHPWHHSLYHCYHRFHTSSLSSSL